MNTKTTGFVGTAPPKRKSGPKAKARPKEAPTVVEPGTPLKKTPGKSPWTFDNIFRRFLKPGDLNRVLSQGAKLMLDNRKRLINPTAMAMVEQLIANSIIEKATSIRRKIFPSVTQKGQMSMASIDTTVSVGNAVTSLGDRPIELAHIVREKMTSGLHEDIKQYRSNRLECGNAPSRNNAAAIRNAYYCQAGWNRKGIYSPYQAINRLNLTSKFDVLSLPCFTVMDWAYVWEQALDVSDVISYEIKDPNADIYLPVSSTRIESKYINLNRYMPVEIKLYVLKCRQDYTRVLPEVDWATKVDPEYLEQPMHMSSSYIYDIVNESQGLIGSETTWAVETAINPLASPGLSPRFKERWEVITVDSVILRPNQELTHVLEEHKGTRASYQHRWNRMREDSNPAVVCMEGDLYVMCSFKGAEKQVATRYEQYADPASGTETYKIIDQNLTADYCGPSRIGRTVKKHAILHTRGAPNTAITPDGDYPDGWSSSKYEDLDTEFDEYSYDHLKDTVEVTTTPGYITLVSETSTNQTLQTTGPKVADGT